MFFVARAFLKVLVEQAHAFELTSLCDVVKELDSKTRGWKTGVHHKHQLLHDKINPKDCQVLSLGDSGFLHFFRVETQVMKWQTPVYPVSIAKKYPSREISR